MWISIINQLLSLDRELIKGFICELICRVIWRYNVCGIKDERAWDLFCDIIFLDPITTRHFSKFKLMWLHRWSRYPPLRMWWAAFHSYMGQMLDKSCDQRNYWRWDDPRALEDRVQCSNPETPSSVRVKHTCEQCSWYGSDYLSPNIEPGKCRQYMQGNFLPVRPPYWDEILGEDGDE